jgi:hypothetical protein
MKTIATLALLLGLAPAAWAQSLFQGDGSPNDAPRKPALKKHDHVQIRFPEREKAPAAAEAEPRVRWDQELREWVRMDAKGGVATVTALTAEVVDLRPNGVVVLQAVKRRSVNKDEETVRLTCEVAADKIVAHATSSDHLANLTLTYDGAGVEGAKPGLLGWLFGKLWPF